MNPIYAWIIAYAAPALLAGGIVKSLPRPEKTPNPRNTIITHATLLFSGFLGQYFLITEGIPFPWFPGILSVVLYVVAISLAAVLIGKGGILYGFSAFVQQFSMLSISLLLLQYFPWYAVVVFIVPLFVWCHTTDTGMFLGRTLLFSAWGVLSVLLFHLFKDIYTISALHTIFGAILVKKGMLYPRKI